MTKIPKVAKVPARTMKNLKEQAKNKKAWEKLLKDVGVTFNDPTDEEDAIFVATLPSLAGNSDDAAYVIMYKNNKASFNLFGKGYDFGGTWKQVLRKMINHKKNTIPKP